jgi:hypothetical protein
MHRRLQLGPGGSGELRFSRKLDARENEFGSRSISQEIKVMNIAKNARIAKESKLAR